MYVEICEDCLKNDILCEKCDEKLKNGDISELEISILRILEQSEDEELKFIKAIGEGNLVVIVTMGSDMGKIIGKGGKNVKLISQELNKRIRIINNKVNFEKLISDVLDPVKILGVSKVFGKNDAEKYKVRIPKSEEWKLPENIDIINNIIKELSNEDFEIVIEK